MQFELLYTAKLHCKHRGELAELAFMRKAANLGFSVAKPWGDSERYDFVLRTGKAFWRIQVKSVLGKSRHRPSYCVHTVSSRKQPYSPEEIDFLVAYIFPEDAWYVFPASEVENRKSVCITPKSKRSRWEKFREAWNLIEQGCAGPGTADTLVQQQTGGGLGP